MAETWTDIKKTSDALYRLFGSNFSDLKVESYFEGWKDYFWQSEHVRKCHLKIIDRTADKKLWLMHINIFPRVDTNLPILGFDIVAGPNKVTGAFFDYSNCVYHPYSDYMQIATESLQWNKPRELPDWAREIFSSNMIAAGNIRGSELNQLCEVTEHLVTYYVENISDNAFRGYNMSDWHNKYCINQKKNPHLHRSITSMGISEKDKDWYVNKILFEEI